MGILIKMIDAIRVETAGTPLDTMHRVSLFKQQLS